ncbi:MAG: hypothetical protein AAGG11_00355 [Pseudomonadota bacterium]
MAHPQRAFRFGTTSRPTFEEFLPGENAELLARLAALPTLDAFVGVWIYAGDSIGKTHLLQAVTSPEAYLHAACPEGPTQFAGQPAGQPVAIDEVERCLGDRRREEGLLALYQLLLARGVPLLVSSRVSPLALTPLLPDLASRLRAFETFALQPPGEAEQRVILDRQARRRGLHLLPEVLDFWLLRRARSLRSRLEDLELVLDYALGAQRPITVPLLKEALGL